MPCGICHYDLNLSNFIFNKDKVFLIDFDRWRYWPFVYELKRFIDMGQNCISAGEVVRGYESVRSLTLEEHRVLD